MHVGDGADPHPIVIRSITIDFVDSFNYLGSLILSTGDLNREDNQCCGLATVTMQSLWKPLHGQNNISCQTKLHYIMSQCYQASYMVLKLAPQLVTHQKKK